MAISYKIFLTPIFGDQIETTISEYVLQSKS